MEDVKAFWEACHRADAIAHLSGVKYSNTINFLHLSDHIRPGIRVLEVGVGLGYVTKSFHEQKITISALDIAETAIDRVRKYCDSTYLIDDIDSLPSDHFDVILCVNVIQHVPTKLLREELFHLIRSLKRDGVFALQFVSSKTGEDLGVSPSMSGIESGTLCRTTKFMGNLINELNAKYDIIYERNDLKKGKVNGIHVFHVRK